MRLTNKKQLRHVELNLCIQQSDVSICIGMTQAKQQPSGKIIKLRTLHGFAARKEGVARKAVEAYMTALQVSLLALCWKCLHNILASFDDTIQAARIAS